MRGNLVWNMVCVFVPSKAGFTKVGVFHESGLSKRGTTVHTYTWRHKTHITFKQIICSNKSHDIVSGKLATTQERTCIWYKQRSMYTPVNKANFVN